MEDPTGQVAEETLLVLHRNKPRQETRYPSVFRRASQVLVLTLPHAFIIQECSRKKRHASGLICGAPEPAPEGALLAVVCRGHSGGGCCAAIAAAAKADCAACDKEEEEGCEGDPEAGSSVRVGADTAEVVHLVLCEREKCNVDREGYERNEGGEERDERCDAGGRS